MCSQLLQGGKKAYPNAERQQHGKPAPAPASPPRAKAKRGAAAGEEGEEGDSVEAGEAAPKTKKQATARRSPKKK